MLGFAGPKHEAEQIKQRLATFLHDDLKLELSQSKTVITHARTRAARFLGYEITTQHNNRRLTRGRRRLNGTIGLRVPRDVIKAKCAPYYRRGKPAPRLPLVNDTDYKIINTYGAEYRGLVQYYLLAGDVFRLDRVCWVMLTSMLATLARKHDSTVTKMAAKYQTTIATPHGPRRCFEASLHRESRKPLVARFGGIPLKRQAKAVLTDRLPLPVSVHGRELTGRLLKGRCELCQQTGEVEVHHVRRLADLKAPGPQPEWITVMAKRRRKTLVVCQACHDTIHRR